MTGGGLCWLDYDEDGWLDLFVVNGHSRNERDEWEARGGLPTTPCAPIPGVAPDDPSSLAPP